MGKEKEDCKYGADCYQKNPLHLQKYRHPNKKRPSDDENTEALKKVKLSRKHEEKKSNEDGEASHDVERKPIEKKNSNEDEESSKNVESKSNEEKQSVEDEETSHDVECKSNDEQTNSKPDFSLELKSLKEVKDKIKLAFLTDMPQDFYEFYNFCKSLSSKAPKKALAAVGLTLVGPFDLFDEKLKSFSKEEALRHYRYYYDPPEFQTVLKGNDKSGEHYGYFRDDPNEPPSFVGRNESEINCHITIVAGNLFGALNFHLEKCKKVADPFKKMQIQKIQTSLSKKSKSDSINLDEVTPEIRKRRSRILAKASHGGGIVVPFDKKTETGYRELAMSESDLKKVLKNLSEAKSESERTALWSQLQPVITFANIACDECDFGTSLELGLHLFSHGSDIFHTTAIQQLKTAYTLLNRNAFIEIIKAHLAQRTKNLSNLSTII